MADDDKRDDRGNLQPRANPPVGWIVDGDGSLRAVDATRPKLRHRRQMHWFVTRSLRRIGFR